MSITEYAKEILAAHGCDEYTYGTTDEETILRDLKSVYPDGMRYSYLDVANAILLISKRKPIVRSPYRMVYDGNCFIDGTDYGSLEQAKADALDTLVNWMIEARQAWANCHCPTEDELDEYNNMICCCCTYVQEYNQETDEYDDYWYPSEEDLEQIGWKELTMEDIRKEKLYLSTWGN